jgi:hypothetical protein
MRQATTLEGRAPVARRSRLVVAAALGVVLAIGGAYAALRGTRGPPASSQPAASQPATTTAGEPCQPTGAARASAETADPGPGTPARIRLGPGLRVKPSAAAIAASRRGQRLVVSGTVYAPDCTTPLEGAVVHLWQANGEGVYGPGPQGPARSGAATCRAPCGPTHAAATRSRRSSRRTTRVSSPRRLPTSTSRSATRQPGCC